jgi:hypothetical protein
VFLYDVTHGQSSDVNWHLNAETIIHEATHQIAFNTSIHNRAAVPPRWVGEGLATLFEAPGVWNARYHPHQSDRINQQRLADFRQYAHTRRPKGSLAQYLRSSDRLFSIAPSIAYSEAWALTFFLSEREPGKYVKYLAKTAAREPLKRYDGDAQLKEFTDVFGVNLNMLEARYLRFIDRL